MISSQCRSTSVTRSAGQDLQPFSNGLPNLSRIISPAFSARRIAVSMENYDSADSYAATALSLAVAYYRTTKDAGFIEKHYRDLAQVASFMDGISRHEERLSRAAGTASSQFPKMRNQFYNILLARQEPSPLAPGKARTVPTCPPIAY